MPTEQFHGVLLENTHALVGSFPDIPLAPGINYEMLTEGDDNPMFITLPIGRVDARSRNDRTYPREAVQTIVDAINERRIGGIRGHLRDEQRAYDYPPNVIQWVGATLEADGTAWGKAYVLRGNGEVREMIRVAKASNAQLGTSIYGTGSMDDDGMVTDLAVESIDLVHPSRVGVPMTAAHPHVTKESESPQGEAEPDALRVGDFVAWDSSGGPARGRIEQIERDGEINIPDSSFTVSGTEDDPAALIQLYDGSEPTDTRVGHKFSTLTKISPPSDTDEGWKSKSKRRRMDDEQRGESAMPEETVLTEADVQSRVKAAVQEARTADRAKIAELSDQVRNMQNQLGDFKPVLELLNNPEYPVVALREKLQVIENLERENRLLLEGYITAQVSDSVSVETVRPMIESLVKQEKPATRSDVDTALDKVRNRPEVKALLKAQIAAEAGPKQTPAPTAPADEDDTKSESAALSGAFIIPEVI